MLQTDPLRDCAGLGKVFDGSSFVSSRLIGR